MSQPQIILVYEADIAIRNIFDDFRHTNINSPPARQRLLLLPNLTCCFIRWILRQNLFHILSCI